MRYLFVPCRSFLGLLLPVRTCAYWTSTSFGSVVAVRRSGITILSTTRVHGVVSTAKNGPNRHIFSSSSTKLSSDVRKAKGIDMDDTDEEVWVKMGDLATTDSPWVSIYGER
jgi:hypothetical protein